MNSRTTIRPALTFLSAVVVCCSASTALATTFKVSTSPGRAVKVSNEAAWDEKCNRLNGPSYTFTTNPAHGSISMRSEAKVITTCNAGACGCVGRRITGTAIYYTPEKTFHGVDQFNFSSRFPNGTELSHQGVVEVK
jgi:hypothetical protein